MTTVILSGFAGFLVGVIGSMIANYLSPPFARFVITLFGRVSSFINPDRFDLTGTWQITYLEPEHNNIQNIVEEVEKAAFNHIGNRVTGESRSERYIREFDYVLTVKHNLVYGEYTKRAAKGNISGTGLVQVIVSPDRIRMDGQMTWFDQETGKIESSKCKLLKVS